MASETISTDLVNFFCFYRRNGSVFKFADAVHECSKFIVLNPHMCPFSSSSANEFGAFVKFTYDELESDKWKNALEHCLTQDSKFTSIEDLVNLMKSWYINVDKESEYFVNLDVMCHVFFNGVAIKQLYESKDWRSEVFREVEESEVEESGVQQQPQEEPNVAAILYVQETPEAIKTMPELPRKRKNRAKNLPVSSKVRRRMTFGADALGSDSDEDRLTILFLSGEEENGAKGEENGAKRKDKRQQKSKKTQKVPGTLRAKVVQVEASLKELDAVVCPRIDDLKADFQVLEDNVHAKLDSGFNKLDESIARLQRDSRPSNPLETVLDGQSGASLRAVNF